MPFVKSFAATRADLPLDIFNLERRDLGSLDVQIEILYCGICHSDIHTARNEWGSTRFPVVPGHEIVGKVSAIGSGVTLHQVGDIVGVGVFVDSCGHCANCLDHLEQYCENGHSQTYNSLLQDKKTITYGGYSTYIVVTEKFVLKVPSNLPLAGVAPLLCAGITTYSPLRYLGVKPMDRVAVIGLGGLGHMAVKLAAAMGAEVTMLSRTPEKALDAERLGAHHFLLTTDSQQLKKSTSSFHYIINTVSGIHDYNAYLPLLKTNGTMVVLGAPPEPSTVQAGQLIRGRKSILGSLVGGIKETQEMLEFCSKHQIVSEVEVIPIQQINEAYERTISGDVHYRFVIDMSSLKK